MQAKAVQGSEASDEFAVTNAVKQGCFHCNLLLCSMLLSEMWRKGSTYRCTTKHLVRERLFTDNSALVAHGASDMQLLVDRFAELLPNLALRSILRRQSACTNLSNLYSLSLRLRSSPSTRSLWCKPLTSPYLGSTVSSNAKLEKELQNRLGKASKGFGNLRQRLWNNRHVSIRTKCIVYREVVLLTLLYGAEVWTIYRTEVKKLRVYMMRQLRDIMAIKWYDKITNDGILSRAHLPWMADILIEKNLRWLGHVQRMENDRFPRQLLYSQLCEGKRNQGRQRLRFKDMDKRNMRHRQINLKYWHTMTELHRDLLSNQNHEIVLVVSTDCKSGSL